jgi:DNA-binding transcriptional ArsR family regulator
MGRSDAAAHVEVLVRSERTAGELAKYVGMSRTAFAHHLTALKRANLIRVEHRGCFQSV